MTTSLSAGRNAAMARCRAGDVAAHAVRDAGGTNVEQASAWRDAWDAEAARQTAEAEGRTGWVAFLDMVDSELDMPFACGSRSHAEAIAAAAGMILAPEEDQDPEDSHYGAWVVTITPEHLGHLQTGRVVYLAGETPGVGRWQIDINRDAR